MSLAKTQVEVALERFEFDYDCLLDHAPEHKDHPDAEQAADASAAFLADALALLEVWEKAA